MQPFSDSSCPRAEAVSRRLKDELVVTPLALLRLTEACISAEPGRKNSTWRNSRQSLIDASDVTEGHLRFNSVSGIIG
jgi:hypothetical protein